MSDLTFRNPVLSIWQSALQQAKRATPKARLVLGAPSADEAAEFSLAAMSESPQKPALRAELAALPVGDCAKLAARFAWAEIRGDQARADELADEIRFGTCDPIWATALAIYLAWKATGRNIPYVNYQAIGDFVIALPDRDLVVGVIGDWGTGLDDAEWLLEQVMAMKPDVLIHLGDIYYSGTPHEVKNNFLDGVNRHASTIPVYTLSGNHDMYAGGKPYYWLLSQLNQAAALTPMQQHASYFSLRNSAWQLLAMDTGYHDADPFSVNTNMTYLQPAEVTWHQDKLANAGTRKNILFSHHQLFTAFDGVGNNAAGNPSGINTALQSAFQPYLNTITAWFWGHEHNLEIYAPYVGLARGRCAGASAIPLLASQHPYQVNTALDYAGGAAPTLVAAAQPLPLNKDHTYVHAFVMLNLAKSGAGQAAYYQIDSAFQGVPSQLYQESF